MNFAKKELTVKNWISSTFPISLSQNLASTGSKRDGGNMNLDCMVS